MIPISPPKMIEVRYANHVVFLEILTFGPVKNVDSTNKK